THKLEQLAYQLSTQAETARDYEHITDVLSDRQLGHILLRLTTCIVTRAHDPAEHDLKRRIIETKLGELGLKTAQITGTPFRALYDMPRLDMDVLTSTCYVAEIAPPVSLELVEEDGLYIADLNIQDLSIPIILNPFATHALVKLGRRSYRAVQHVLIIGMSGAGKSGLGVILAYRAKKHQNASLFIIDIKGTDYRKLANKLGLETVRPSGLDPIALWTPSTLGVDPTSAGLAVAGIVATLLRLEDQHLINRIASEIAHHYRTSREHGLRKLITEVQDNNIRELLQELYNTYHDYVVGNVPNIGQDIVLSFDKIPDIGDPSRIENPKTITLILALPLVLHYALRVRDRAYAIMDEAWRLLKLTHTQHMLELMFRTFRSLNIAIVFITQDYEDLYDSEIGHVLLNNSDIHVIMKQRSRRSIELLRKNYGIPENLLRTIYPETEVGVGILSTRGHLVPIRVKLFEEEWKILPE
ncbi:MAG: DUF87 domain-containing protein, partial [Crenarchaeota archaeon]|nr:DUF87 domain-containing protein [Thermoproteota archaeon]